MTQSTRTVRRMEVTWTDPLEVATRADGMSGRQTLEAIRDGRLPPPPVAALLGLELLEVEDGRTAFRFSPGEQHLNPAGAVAGGVLALIMDLATATAISTQCPAGTVILTANLNVTFVKGAGLGEAPPHCEGRLVHLGRTLAHATGEMTNGDGSLAATCTATCRVIVPSV
jgi:uncharacterized protein (TIGR00369 family)